MKDTFKTFPYKFTDCEKLPIEPIPAKCWVCPQYDCCKWKRRIVKELRERRDYIEANLPRHRGVEYERLLKEILEKVRV